MQISISNAIGGGGGAKGGGTPPFSNVNSFLFDGVDEKMFSTANYTELNGSTNFSISFWIKPIGTNANAVWEIETQGNSERLTCRYIGSQQRIYITFRSQSYYYGSAVNSVLLNQWSHIVYTYNASLSRYNRPEIYVNGALSQGTNSGVPYASSNFNGTLTFGDSVRYEYGNNYIDEFAVWNSTTLTQTQANELYNGGTPSDLNNIASGLAQPTTWFRMGEEATWNGFTWTMTDVNGGTVVRAANMQESSRTTDVPTASSFANTKSILLDGVDDYVNISNAITLVDDFSISAWIKPSNTTDAYNMILSCGSVGPYFAVRSGGKLHFYLSSTYETSSGVIAPNVWSHVAVTRTSGVLQLYINGAAFGSTSTQSNVIGSQTYNIGRYAPTSGFQFTGNIDELALFNSSLSASDITSIYGGGVPSSLSSYSSLVSWWRCGDGDTAPILTDNGSGGNNGTMTNFTTFSTDVPT